MAYDIVIRNAQLRSRKEKVDIGIEKGVIREIGTADPGGATVIDAGGNLVTDPSSTRTFTCARSTR